jgi:hypothetical protein
MMVACHAIVADEQTAAAGARTISIYPDIEVLDGLTSTKSHKHLLDDLATLGRAVKEGPKKYLRRTAETIRTEEQ